MRPSDIRIAVTSDGHIEASLAERWRVYRYVVIDRQTGDVLETNAVPGTTLFRWLVVAARKHTTK